MTTLNTEFKVKHGIIVNGKTTLTGTNNDVGTIAAGNWNGTPVSLQYGGTGQNLSAATGYIQVNAGSLSVSTTIPAAAITGTLSNSTTGNAATATKLSSPRTINMTGDVSWSSSAFDGSGNATGISTLSTTGVVANTYKSVDVDSKGRVTGGSNPTTLAGYGITDAAPSSHTTDTALHLSTLPGLTAAQYGSSTTIPLVTIDTKGRVTNITTTAISISSTNAQLNSLGVGTAATGTTGEIVATGNITAYYSDDRLKTRLGNIVDALEKVMTLDAFYYEANETAQQLGYSKVREVGVSAQQIDQVLPEIVAPAPINAQYLTVRYERIVPLLIAAIKELNTKVDELSSNINKN